MIATVDLRVLRLNLGLGLGEAAEAMGIDRDTLSRAERGDTRPHPRNQLRIARYYGFQPTDIWPPQSRDPDAAGASA